MVDKINLQEGTLFDDLGKQDEQKTIKIGDKEYTVPPELADAMLAEHKAMKEGLEKAQSDAEILRQQQVRPPEPEPKPEPKPEPTGDEDDLATLLFTNPDKALRLHAEQITKGIEDRLTKQYKEDRAIENQKRELENFWRGFDEKNPELKEFRDYSEVILRNNFEAWQDLTADEVAEKLSEKTRDSLLSVVDRFGNNDNNQDNNRAVFEGGQRSAQNQQEDNEQSEKGQGKDPASLTELLKARKQARRKAAGLDV